MTVIALVDGSTYSASVCDHAAWAATRMQTGVEILHTLDRPRSSVPADLSGSLQLGARSALLEELAKSDADRARLAHARGRLVLEEAAARLRAAGIDPIEEKLRNETILDAIARFEPEAKLLVVGKRGEETSATFEHLGSNLERILRAAHKPVLIANRAFQPVTRYLVAFDGSPAVMGSIERIAAGSLLNGLSCRLLHVGTDTAPIRAQMEGAAALLRPVSADVTIEFARGEPDTTIARAVENGGADLLVMGAYASHRLRKLFLGSTSAAMARMCRVPVMIFR